ncbi:MAG: hypothetical protein K0R71_2315 [Bacillales bacterium]|jgi:uncharacterized protein YrzB (UPF0473 family)|nr:hypothetical protein [Bacillales bacterium]
MTTYENEEIETISIVDDEGNEQLFEILLTFDLEKYNKSYVCVAPLEVEEEEEEGDIFVFAYTQDESGEAGRLDPVEDEEEFAACEEVINTFIEAEELDETEE